MERSKPKCKLIGTDGNVFALMGKVRMALKGASMHDEAEEFMHKVQEAKSYDEALRIM